MAVILELAPTGANSHLTVTLRYTSRFGGVGAVIDSAVKGSVTRAQQRSADAFGALGAHEHPSL